MTTMTERTVTETVNLPAGTYFIGDPCHVLSSSNIKWPSRDQSNGPWQIQDMPAALFEAYGGDGVRRDCEEYRYEVESGHIAVIPAALITEPLPWTLRILSDHKRGNLQYDGTEWRGVSVHRSWRSIVKNPPTPTTSGYAQR